MGTLASVATEFANLNHVFLINGLARIERPGVSSLFREHVKIFWDNVRILGC